MWLFKVKDLKAATCFINSEMELEWLLVYIQQHFWSQKKQQQKCSVWETYIGCDIAQNLKYLLTERHLCTNLIRSQIHSIQTGWALKILALAILGSHVVWSQKIRCGGIGVEGNAPLVCDPFVSIVACWKLKSQRPAILASRNLGKMVGRGCADPIPGISARSCFICRIQFWWQVIFGYVLARFWQRNKFPCDLTCKWCFNSIS